MKTTTLLARLASIVAIALVTAPVVRAADEAQEPDPNAKTGHLRVTVKAGEEVLVRDHHNWTRTCKPEENPPVTITRQPKSGTVEVRPGEFEVKRSLGNEVCFGKTMPGNGVYYRAGATPGRDSFRYKVVLGTKNKLPWEFEVQVTIE
jgi:hypothetical protein